MASMLVGCAPGLRKLPCKDLTDVFADLDDPEDTEIVEDSRPILETQLLDATEWVGHVHNFSPAFRGRGPKGTRGGNPPSRDPAITPSTSQGVGKKAKASQPCVDEEAGMQTSMDVLGTTNGGSEQRVRMTGVVEKVALWDKFLQGSGSNLRENRNKPADTDEGTEDADCQEVVKVGKGSLSQVGYVVGSLVELLHPKHGSDVVGKGRAGNHFAIEPQCTPIIPKGMQLVTITESVKEGAGLLVHMDIDPPPKFVEDAVGYQILWPVQHDAMAKFSAGMQHSEPPTHGSGRYLESLLW